MYANEQIFSNKLSNRLKRQGIYIQKIESHYTGNGIPDMFLYGHGLECFIELKSKSSCTINSDYYKIEWRPGQQAWYENYYKAMYGTKCCLTIVDVYDGLLFIPNNVIYNKNIVNEPIKLNINEVHYNVTKLIFMLTNMRTKFKTFREACNDWLNYWYYNENIKAEDIWNSNIDIDSKFNSNIFLYEQGDMFKKVESSI